MSRVLAAIAVVAFISFTPAAAETGWNISVPYGDLDLTQQSHARIMAERIDDAARRACGGNPRFDPNYRTGPARATQRFETCRTRAVESALADLNRPLVARAFGPHARLR